MLGLIRQVGVSRGGENAVMTEVFLDFDQIDACLNQVRGIAVTQAVRADLFFRPQAATTLRKVICTPPRSSGVVAVRAPFTPP